NGDFFNHKKHRYGLQAIIICDDQKYITGFNSQYPGSINVTRAFEELQNYFGDDKYLLGDSAYTSSIRLLALFNFHGRGNHELSRSEKQYNKYLSHLRVRVEHSIGSFKTRYASLQCLPNRIIHNFDLPWSYACIGSSVIFHNLLIHN
ncbi:hypothetical protein K440DRAFT_546670, partial [Wilcoxina mikolae CBS 423.85]